MTKKWFLIKMNDLLGKKTPKKQKKVKK